MTWFNRSNAAIDSFAPAKLLEPGNRPAARRVERHCFHISYQFPSGQCLVGTVAGDVLTNLPNLAFNLDGLEAVLRSPSGTPIARFDQVFGQFRLDRPEVIISGSDSATGAFFGFNYRAGEAMVLAADPRQCLASGWRPAAWQLAVPAASPEPSFSDQLRLWLGDQAPQWQLAG